MSAPALYQSQHDRLLEAVSGLISGDDWAQMLAVAARFHHYSPANILMVLRQRPEATQVAGYRTWIKLGRRVRRGERAISIWAPRFVAGDDGEPSLEGFHLAKVFDLAQTEGPPLPEVLPQILAEHCDERLIEASLRAIEARHFTLSREDCGEANGLTDYRARRVCIHPRLNGAAMLKTAVHELAHVELHASDHRSRDVKEIEAESIAHLTCASLGVQTDAYSFPYVARWSAGKLDLVRSTAEVVLHCAKKLANELRLNLPEGTEELALQQAQGINETIIIESGSLSVGEAIGDAGRGNEGSAQQLTYRQPSLALFGADGRGGERGGEDLDDA
ncbi:MAG: ArdC-like ssDNA-binding domain-containing protein [Actinomycetes bacterium]